jgi:hypothetical protein
MCHSVYMHIQPNHRGYLLHDFRNDFGTQAALSPESTVACLPRLTRLRRPQSHRSSCSRDVMNAWSCSSRKRREAPPWCSRSLRCFWTLCCVQWCLATDVSGQYTGPVVKSQAARKHFFFRIFLPLKKGPIFCPETSITIHNPQLTM